VSDYLDPTDSVAVPRQTAARPTSLDGKVVTLLDISGRGEHLLDRLEELLRERAGQGVVRRKKPTFSSGWRLRSSVEIVGATDVLIEALAIEGPAQRAVCTTACSSRITASYRDDHLGGFVRAAAARPGRSGLGLPHRGRRASDPAADARRGPGARRQGVRRCWRD
jgi:hypothetical protein